MGTSGKPNRLPLAWVLAAMAVLAVGALLYAGLGGPDETVVEEEQEGIEMREDVDAVVFTDDNATPPEDQSPSREAERGAE